MTGQTILLIEDNPLTRKMLRLALASDGYHVVEAGDRVQALAAARERRPDLVLLDYVLPDTDGLRLLVEVRDAAADPQLPALMVTGLVSRLDELRERAGPHAQVLAKPIEPMHLLELVRAHLTGEAGIGLGRRILVIDDDPLNLKLSSLYLQHGGYQVETASSGELALAKARQHPPDAILADVLMPSMDGFAFCLEARRDPLLVSTPVVLVSAAYVEPADRDLAHLVGASALVARSAELREAIDALESALQGARPMSVPQRADLVAPLHQERLRIQLERQTARAEMLARQAAIQATALSVIRGLSETLAQPLDAPRIVGDVLVHCLDATGLSTGLLYLVDEGRLRLEAQFGIPVERREDAEEAFGHQEMIREVVDSGQPIALSLDPHGSPLRAPSFLSGLGQTSALFVPFAVLGRSFGLLVLASDTHDLSDSAWLGFARSLAGQFGQTVALGQSLARLAASEERYRTLMEQANDAILVLDSSQRILTANRRAERLLDRVQPEIAGRPFDEFVVARAPGAAQGARTLMEEAALGVLECDLARAGGERIPVDLSASPVRLGPDPRDSVVMVIVRDVTERKRLETQLLQAQKMESVGRLAGGVAHDFNNILGVIAGYAAMLRKRLGHDARLSKFADEILSASDRATNLTRQLLAFSRRQVLQPRILDLNTIVGEIETMLRRLIGEDKELRTRLQPRLAPVRADANQVEQVLMNLIVNACDAMPTGGRILIETADVTLDEPYVLVHPEAQPGRYAMLSVSDTGQGMSGEVQARIFEPFFTTKEPGKGTGLGLATVHGIVRQSGGHIFVYSEPGRGTTFKIYLPTSDQPPEGRAPTAEEEAPPTGTETILLVEDEAALRAIVKECLEASGYRVLDAADAGAALALCEGDQSAIDLLLTDVVMPGIGGAQLAARLGEQRPGLKVVYMSGYTDDAMVLQGVFQQGVTFLEKPFTPGTLARRVRQALDRPGA